MEESEILAFNQLFYIYYWLIYIYYAITLKVDI